MAIFSQISGCFSHPIRSIVSLGRSLSTTRPTTPRAIVRVNTPIAVGCRLDKRVAGLEVDFGIPDEASYLLNKLIIRPSSLPVHAGRHSGDLAYVDTIGLLLQ